MSAKSTTEREYTERLKSLQTKTWKTVLDVQRPYRWNLRRLNPGKTLEVGCGIGRCLKGLPAGSVGIDHNEHSIRVIRDMGLEGFLPDDFRRSPHGQQGVFDTLLLCHVLEHMTPQAGIDLIREYLPFLTDNGMVVLICPQEKGFSTDETHVQFLDTGALRYALTQAGLTIEKTYSFPLPRFMGKLFTYNEFVATGRKC